MCDGNNSTPDLRNRFVIGSGAGSSYSVNQTGGSKDATLVSHSHTINNHTHSFTTGNPNTTLTGSATYVAETWGSAGQASGIFGRNGGYNQYYTPASVDSSPTGQLTIDATHTHSGTTGNPSNTGTNSQGSSATNANLPPYYALAYIMKA